MVKGKTHLAKGALNKRVKKLVRAGSGGGFTKGGIRRLARRAGVKRLSALVFGEVRASVAQFVKRVITDTTAYTEHARRKTVTAVDVVNALKKGGRMLYGYA